MPASLTATPLPDVAGVRLSLSASASQQIVVDEDYGTGPTPAQIAAWTPVTTSTAVGPASWALNPRTLPIRNTTTATPGTNYAARRTLSGLVVGRTYQVIAPVVATSTVASVSLTVDTPTPTTVTRQEQQLYDLARQVEWTRGPDGTYTSAWLVFVATATTHTLTVRAVLGSSAPSGMGTIVDLYALDVRWVGTNTKRLEVAFNASDLANWSIAGPTIATRTLRESVYGVAPVQWFPITVDYQRATAGTSATFPADQQTVQRTLTGLTVGRRYRVLAAASARISPTLANLRTRVGVVGIGESPASVEQWRTFDFVASATTHTLYVKLADSVTVHDTQSAWMSVLYLRAIDLYADLTNVYTLDALTRTDVNGTAPVRLYEDQTLTDGVLLVSDFEAALTGLIRYDVERSNSSTGQAERVSASTTLAGAVGPLTAVVAPATLPQFRAFAVVTDDYSAAQEPSGTVHRPIDRPYALPTLGRLRSRSGRYVALVDTYAQGVELLDVFQRGEVVLIRFPELARADMYHVVDTAGVTLTPDQGKWSLSVNYVETGPPVGPLLGSLGWTFDAALAAFPTFAQARLAYPTFNDYVVGPAL